MLRAIADTHAVIWYLFDDPRLSLAARTMFQTAAESSDQIGFSAITLAEIVYLAEKGRIHSDVFGRILNALDQPGAVLHDLPLDRAVTEALQEINRKDVPDLPDYVIAATAWSYRLPLISRDRQIQHAGLRTIWRIHCRHSVLTYLTATVMC